MRLALLKREFAAKLKLEKSRGQRIRTRSRDFLDFREVGIR
jgi:hypothetical protein